MSLIDKINVSYLITNTAVFFKILSCNLRHSVSLMEKKPCISRDSTLIHFKVNSNL